MTTTTRSERPLLRVPELNRALLARQHLLDRTAASAVAMVDHLVGLQAQNPSSPYPALWSRLSGFTHDDLSRALQDRSLTRIVVMRGTIHLVTADDAMVLPALVAPLLTRDLRTNATYAAPLRDVDLDDLADAARDLVEAEPMTAAVLGAALARRWPDVDPRALAYGARGLLPLVQVTPRGMWRRSGQPTWTTTRAWLGREPADLTDPAARQAALEQVTLRYLAAFGPASVADLQYWCGLTGLRDVMAALRPRLSAFRAEPTAAGRPGRELFDLPDAPRPVVDTASGGSSASGSSASGGRASDRRGRDDEPPIRFLPDFDNLTIAHADRTRVIAEEHRQRFISPNGVGPGKVLIDGMAAGTWRVDRTTVPGRAGAGGSRRRDRTSVAELVVVPFEQLGARRRRAATEEADRLVRFVADDADEHRVTVAG